MNRRKIEIIKEGLEVKLIAYVEDEVEFEDSYFINSDSEYNQAVLLLMSNWFGGQKHEAH